MKPWQTPCPSCTRGDRDSVAQGTSAWHRGPRCSPGTPSGSPVPTDRICIPVLESFGNNNPRAVRGLNAGPSACHPWNWDKPLESALMCLPEHPCLSTFDCHACQSSLEHPLPPQSIHGCLVGSQGAFQSPTPPSREPGHEASPSPAGPALRPHVNAPWSF